MSGEEGTGFRLIYDAEDPSTGKPTTSRYTVLRAAGDIKPPYLEFEGINAHIAQTTWLYLDSGSVYEDSTAAVALAERVHNDGMHVVFNMS